MIHTLQDLMSFWRHTNTSTLELSVSKFKQALDEFELALDSSTPNITDLFAKYDGIKDCAKCYLVEKLKLRESGIDITNNPHIARFKKLNERLHTYEEQLLMFGVNLKGKEITTNSALLGEALRINKESTNKLVGALETIHSTIGVANEIGTTIVSNREKIESVSRGLDHIESELSIANKRVTNFMKRLSTDKVFIAMTGLVVAGAATATGLHFIPLPL